MPPTSGDTTLAGAPPGPQPAAAGAAPPREAGPERKEAPRSTAARSRPAQGRRALSSAIHHAPHTLRALVRADEIWLVVVAAIVGCACGLAVAAMTIVTQHIHEILFALLPGQRLSGMVEINRFRAILVPSLGGLGFGLLGVLTLRWWPRRAVDPIEANALYGGTMSVKDSLLVVLQTVISTGVGASVGLEAGYTQIGSAFASRLGRSFRVRRGDLRMLVGCGAAGAIAAAFQAPLTGSFYAFELVIGTYTLVSLAPVVISSIVAVAVANALNGTPGTLELQVPSRIEAVDYVAIIALGMVCALVGIAIMRGVTLTEEMFRKSKVPVWLRPSIGGLAIGALALVTPSVLSSGHAALAVGVDAPYPLPHVAMIIVLKATASAVSIGSGFRGGLFFASLFLGAMVGKLFAGLLAMITTAHAIPPVVCAMVGMSSMAVAIIGGPLTMGFLALEDTGSLPMTIAVLAACVISSLTVRRTFGYSFATWRFHLRGESIRSAVDVGWMRNLTVGRMMRREVRTVRADTPIAIFRRDFPLGATQRVVAVDDADRYAGIVLLAEAHADAEDGAKLADILHYADAALLPQMTVKQAIGLFEAAESDALAVLDGPETKRVIGLLTEQFALRRYSEELDRRRRELSGE